MQTGGEGQEVSISRVSRDTWAFNAQGGYPVCMQTDNVIQIPATKRKLRVIQYMEKLTQVNFSAPYQGMKSRIFGP